MLRCLINGKSNNLIDTQYTKDEWKKWAAKGIVLCPVCNKPYEYCHGRIKIPYFRHKDKNECLDKYSETETQEHLEGKKDIYDWLKTVDGISDLRLEAWIPATKQRPDLYFRYQDKEYVIEYQCSPISSEYLERHELYEAASINDIWICGAQNYFQEYHKGKGLKRINIIEKEYGLYYDPKVKKLFILDKMSEKVFEKSKFKEVKARIKSYIPSHGWIYYVPEKYIGNHSKARASLLNLNELLNKVRKEEAPDGRDQSTAV